MNSVKNYFGKITPQKVIAVILGNIIIGVGAGLLCVSGMGNDPFNASTLAISTGFGMAVGNYQLLLNVVLLVIQLIFGRKYIGFGTIINMVAVGYVLQFTTWVVGDVFGVTRNFPIYVGIAIMALAILVISFGLSMYQCADLGVAPFDFLSLGMTEHLPIPYRINRIITDFSCVLVILLALVTGFIQLKDCHLGVATIIVAFCLGPFIDFFSRYNRRWITPEKKNA